MALPREKTTGIASKSLSRTETHRASSAAKITDDNDLVGNFGALRIAHPDPALPDSPNDPSGLKQVMDEFTIDLDVLASVFTNLASVDLNATVRVTPVDGGRSTPSTLSNLGSRYREASSKAFALSHLCRQFAESLGADVQPEDPISRLPIVTKALITALERLKPALEDTGLETSPADLHARSSSAVEERFLGPDHVEAEPEPAAEQDLALDALTETFKTTSLTSSPTRVPSPTPVPDFESLALKYAESPFIFRVQDSSSHTNYSDQLGFTAGLFLGIPAETYSHASFAERFCSHLHRKPIASQFISTGTDLRFSVRGLHEAKRGKKKDVKLMIIDSSKLLLWKTNAGKFLRDHKSVEARWKAGLSRWEEDRKWEYHQSEVLVWEQIPAEAIVATIKLVDLERAVEWGVKAEEECIRKKAHLRVWKNLERVLALQSAWRNKYVSFRDVTNFISEPVPKPKRFPWDDMGVVENPLSDLAGAIQRMLNVRDPEAGLFLMGILLGWVVGYQPGDGPKNCWDPRMGGVDGVKKLWENWSEAERLWREAEEEEEERREGRLIYDRNGGLPVRIPPSKVHIICPSCGACCTLGSHAQRCNQRRCLCVQRLPRG